MRAAQATSHAGRLGALLGIAVVSAVAACHSDPTSPPPLSVADVAGTYALVSINGHPMPAPYTSSFDVLYDTIALAPNGTWTQWQGGAVAGRTVATDTGRYAGTWTLDAANRQVLQRSTDRYGNVTVDTLAVGGRGAMLTFDTSRNNPSGYNVGPWLYNRVQ